MSAAGALSRALEDDGTAESHESHVRALRQQAAESSQALVLELRKTWITPFDPQEIRELLVSMDAVMSLIHGARERLAAFRLPRQHEARSARLLADILQQCCSALARGLKLLREKKRDDEILRSCEEVKQLNARADDLYRSALADLYDSAGGDASRIKSKGGGAEDEAGAVGRLLGVLKWHEILDKLDEATTRCSRSALSIEAVVSGRA